MYNNGKKAQARKSGLRFVRVLSVFKFDVISKIVYLSQYT
jgi:hypothetical protein